MPGVFGEKKRPGFGSRKWNSNSVKLKEKTSLDQANWLRDRSSSTGDQAIVVAVSAKSASSNRKFPAFDA